MRRRKGGRKRAGNPQKKARKNQYGNLIRVTHTQRLWVGGVEVPRVAGFVTGTRAFRPLQIARARSSKRKEYHRIHLERKGKKKRGTG